MKYLYKLGLLFTFLGILSCDLEEDPYGFYSEENFYQTEADATAAINYAYDALTYLEYSRAIYFLGDLPTDEIFPKNDEGIDVQNLNNWQVSTFQNNNILNNFFKYAYIAINRSNAVLENVPEANYDEQFQNQIVGEAYFLRAWNYFNLVRAFGNVPIHKNVVQTLNQTSAPLSENLDEIYDLIISDCEKSIELLGINQRLGRADKVAAQALLAKVYLQIASAKENGVSQYMEMNREVNSMYSMAEQTAAQVLEGHSVYGFEDNLLDIYDVEMPLGSENIFLLSMDRSGTIEGDYSKISKLFIPYIDGATIYLPNPNGTYTPSHDGWSVFNTQTEFYNSYDNSDKRKTELIVDSVYNAQAELSATYPGAIVYPFSRKYIDPNFIGDKTSTKPFLLRYSDVALIYAEAAGPTSQAYDYVNYIRNRAGLNDLESGLSIDDFREAVLRERKWELAWEGNRLYDLRRFNIVTETVSEASGLSKDEANFYPLPQREIDLNPSL
ncbi:RagB/SusD family nutrient uptake outer membrane protein [Gramella sp. AN32]|uniref:RagB/SusD family nutrient uptake outer membrane protein n=1 Tax=Christiangramia antarctica TaxID=2058158 RepID=A0ABW5X7I6_9FLAO|nr:RagB/SusD family nutrient uptake outer membrane protein [Gramella sp. AN32]MCM4157798.1 RagB/SusD family nutrient uptake outer membrane protein [Gramella sp. AN32]